MTPTVPQTEAGRPEPLTPEEEAQFRESVAVVTAAMPDDYSLQWSNLVAARLLATLDRDREAATLALRSPERLREALEALHEAVCACPFDGSDPGCNLVLTGADLGLVRTALESPRKER